MRRGPRPSDIAAVVAILFAIFALLLLMSSDITLDDNQRGSSYDGS